MSEIISDWQQLIRRIFIFFVSEYFIVAWVNHCVGVHSMSSRVCCAVPCWPVWSRPNRCSRRICLKVWSGTIYLRLESEFPSLRKFQYFKSFKMVAGHYLEFDPTWSSSVRSADPENSTLKPNIDRDRMTCCRDKPHLSQLPGLSQQGRQSHCRADTGQALNEWDDDTSVWSYHPDPNPIILKLTVCYIVQM